MTNDDVLLLDDAQRIATIADQIEFLARALKGMTLDRFRIDVVLQRGVATALQAIGRAAEALPEAVRQRAPRAAWAQFIALSQKPMLTDVLEMWRLCTEEAPWLRQQLFAAGLSKRA